jgi:hypothetical protein
MAKNYVSLKLFFNTCCIHIYIYYMHTYIYGKGKDVPVTGHGGP